MGMPEKDKTYYEEREKAVESLKADMRFVTFNRSSEFWEFFLDKLAKEAYEGLSAVDMDIKPLTTNVFAPLRDERTFMLEHNIPDVFGMPFAECKPDGDDYDLHRWNAIATAESNAQYIKEHGLDEFIIRYGDKNNLPEE